MVRAAPSCARPPIDVYVFRDSAFAHGGNSVVCIVEKIIAEECLGGRWRDLFGGGAIYEAEMERAFIGVWGTRNAARLRRFLRERGADLTIRHDRPIGLRLRQWNATQGRRPRIRGMNKGGDAGAIDVT